MLRIFGLLLLMVGSATAAPEIGKDYGKLGPSAADQTPVFLLNDEYRADFNQATKCPLKAAEGDIVYIGKKAVYADGKQGVVVLLDEFARRYALNYCWQ